MKNKTIALIDFLLFIYTNKKSIMLKLTAEKAEAKLAKINPNVIFLDQYSSSRVKNHFKCLVCNSDWFANSTSTINGKSGCVKCKNDKNFKYQIKKIFGDKLNIISEYIDYLSDIKVECQSCNHKWISKPKNLIAGYGCVKCGHVEKGKKLVKKHSVFLSEINSVYGDKLSILEKYTDCRNRIKVKCNVCNYEWSPISGRLSYRGCPKCNFSKGELLISNILNEMQINFKPQYIFEGLKTDMNGTPIFDFAVFDEINNIKCIIEYDGEQHFKPAKKWGGEKKFKRQKEIDKFKTNYCNTNNIKIIRIPYTELNKINKNYIENLL